MKRHKTLTLVGSGALAASVLIAVLLLSASAPTVSAGVILADLQLALGKTILIQFQNIEMDYTDLAARMPDSQFHRGTLTCDGRVFIPSQPSQEAFWELENIYLRGLSASTEGTGGFDADAKMTMCLRDENPWLFVELDDAADAPPPAPGPGAAVVAAFREGMYIALPSLEFSAQDAGEARQVIMISPEFAQLGDLQHVLGRLEEIATDITVAEAEPGLFVLTAAGFHGRIRLPVPDHSELTPGTREGLESWLQDMMRDQVVEVGYRVDDGVRWIHVRHFGRTDGCIDVQVGDVEFDTRLFDLDYHLERRSAPVVDASALLALVDMLDRAAADEPL
jgi:hypothetical protein